MALGKKLNKLTDIPVQTLSKLKKCIYMVHSQDVVEQVMSGTEMVSIELVEGTLYLKVTDDNIEYKFIPSKNYEAIILKAVSEKESYLLSETLDSLKKVLLSTYKDLY